jgi:hypothetical protein
MLGLGRPIEERVSMLRLDREDEALHQASLAVSGQIAVSSQEMS